MANGSLKFKGHPKVWMAFEKEKSIWLI